jgi:hypothetical protein
MYYCEALQLKNFVLMWSKNSKFSFTKPTKYKFDSFLSYITKYSNSVEKTKKAACLVLDVAL